MASFIEVNHEEHEWFVQEAMRLVRKSLAFADYVRNGFSNYTNAVEYADAHWEDDKYAIPTKKIFGEGGPQNIILGGLIMANVPDKGDQVLTLILVPSKGYIVTQTDAYHPAIQADEMAKKHIRQFEVIDASDGNSEHEVSEAAFVILRIIKERMRAH